jgi:hypothetical protein
LINYSPFPVEKIRVMWGALLAWVSLKVDKHVSSPFSPLVEWLEQRMVSRVSAGRETSPLSLEPIRLAFEPTLVEVWGPPLEMPGQVGYS